MGWVEDLHGRTVGLDSSPLIYFIERHETYIDVLRPFFQAVDRGQMKVVTSTITLLEVLVHPIRCGDEVLAHKYNDILLTSPNIAILSLTPALAQVAAELRAEYKLKTPDAVQLATAKTHGAAALFTNDRDFNGVTGIEILKLRDLKQ
jgi:predicted nucleic acid-binding protein